MPARCGSLYQRNLKRIEKLTLELKSLLTEKSNFKIKNMKIKIGKPEIDLKTSQFYV